MKKILLYITAALLSFLVFVLAFAPAAPAWMLVEDDVKRRLPGLDVMAMEGTIWSGAARLQYRNFPPSSMTWQLEPLPLLKGHAHVELTAAGDGHLLEGRGQMSNAGGAVRHLSGYLQSSYINTVSEGYGLTFAGQLDIEELALTTDQRWLTAADGSIHWTGGRIIYRTYRETQVFELPPLDGDLSLDGQALVLNIHHQGQTALAIRLKPDGWALVDLRGRLFELANLPWPQEYAPDDTVLMVEERILPGMNQATQ